MKKNKLNLLTDLFMTFLKIGGFTIGGGYTMLPIIEHEVVNIKKWATQDEVSDYMVLASSMPGVIGTNLSTAVGIHVGGFLGGVCATVGMVAPSVVVIIVIAMFFEDFQKWEVVQSAFMGVRAAVVALMFRTFLTLFKGNVKDKFQFALAALATVAVVFVHIPPQYVLLCGAALGLAYGRFGKAAENGHDS